MADWHNNLGVQPIAASVASDATGSWDDPQLSLWQSVLDRWRREGQRLHELGHAGAKEQARDMYGVGHFVDAYDAGKEGRYLPAAGDALLGVADLTAPARSKAVSAADAALQAWNAATKARPAQLTERAAQELEKLLPASGRYSEQSAAHTKRLNRAQAQAERGIPEPITPGGLSSGEAERMLDVSSQTWPGNLLAGAIAAGGASGIPGTVIDDTKNALAGPAAAFDQDVRDYREPEKSYRLDDPHIKKIHDDMERTNNVLVGHIGAGAAMAAATPKLAQLGWRGTSGPMLGLAAELGMIHPIAGAAALGVAALPMLPAIASGYGAYKMADDTGPLRDRALALKDILDEYGRRGQNRLGPDAQASYDREGY